MPANSTGIYSPGFLFADDFTTPRNDPNRPAPPAPAMDQPFGYRFRTVSEASGEPIVFPRYDPERQVSLVKDGLVPMATNPTYKKVWKITETWTDGFFELDEFWVIQTD